jgi:hypothetical protein
MKIYFLKLKYAISYEYKRLKTRGYCEPFHSVLLLGDCCTDLIYSIVIIRDS